MEWVIATLVTINLVYTLILNRDLQRLGVENKQMRELILAGKPKQMQVKSKHAHARVPVVDARAVTVNRDTDDLPLTGRQSTGLHRKRRDYGTTDDS